jgi:hypothetical protein
METVIVHPKNKEQLSALKAFVKALKMDFEIKADSPYDPDFVDMVRSAQKEVDEGKLIKLDPTKSIWENLQ